jgi:murein DD-endopeptidase MepM/ murein hydrolase activator NlpD
VQRVLAILIGLTLILAACGPTGSPPAGPLFTSGPTLPPAPTYTPPPTGTPGPTRTPRPTATPTPTSTPTPTPVPPLAGRLSVDPGQVIPGRTVAVHITGTVPISVSAWLGDQELRFFSAGDTQYALAGISIWAAPGSRSLTATLRDEWGRVTTLTTTVQVLPADYPVEDVTLPPDRQELLDPDITAQEWAYVQPFLEEVTPERLWEGGFISPTKGWITSPYGGMRAYNGAPPSSYHNGLDIGNYSGTLIIAPAAGRVVVAEELVVRGNCVILDHGWGLHTSYFHMSALLVEPGMMVQQGDPIGRMGSTGLATGSHLHWEVRVGMITVDPEEWLVRTFP